MPNIDTNIIFSKLQDDESRELFQHRYKYYQDRDEEHLWDMLSTSRKCTLLRRKGKPLVDFWYAHEEGLLTKNEVLLYGAGLNAYYACQFADRYNINVKCICDSNVAKHNALVCDHVVVAPEQMLAEYPDVPIIITPVLPGSKKEILAYLVAKGVSDDKIFLYYPFNSPEKEEQYFSPSFLTPQPNEVYVDAGCWDGETILDFYKFANRKYKKIYGFEPAPECFERTQKCIEVAAIKNVIMNMQGLWDKKEKLNFDMAGIWQGGSHISAGGTHSIDTIALDEAINPNDKVTFIKMDIEGAELKALQGAKNTIMRDLPRLAICIYHKPEDIITVPEYILSISSKYVFYIRHHSNCFNETVLYAIPK